MQNTPSIHSRLASIFPLGKAPVAPGTVATLVAGVPCFLVIGRFSMGIQAAIVLALLVAGSYVSGKAEKELGGTDPQEVVIDELCGYLVAMAGHPAGFLPIVAGFLLFRTFDIWKPWPIRLVEKKLTGGIAVMLDDVVAGIFANILLVIILKLV